MPYPNYTIKASGGDFTLLSAWETDAQANFDGSQPIDVAISNGTYNGTDGAMADNCQIQDWAVDPTAANDVVIRTATPADGHQGVYGDGFTLISNGTNCFRISEPYITLRGFSVIVPTNRFTYSTEANHTVDSMIVRKTGGESLNMVFTAIGGTTNHTYRNSVLIDDSTRIIIDMQTANSACVIEGCTIVRNGASGYCITGASNSNILLRDTVCAGLGINIRTTRCDPASTNNATTDLTAGDLLNGQTGVVLTDGIDFVAPSTNDYNPVASGKLDGTGADLSGSFTDDIAGNEREVPWEIGAYEIQGAATLNEMYIKDGGIFVKYTPHVKVGGTFQEVDAYVLEGGAWVPVHEK